MSGGRRIQRLNAQLQREISALLRKDVGDPRVEGVTVTRVAITSDLSIARVFVRHLAGPDRLVAALDGLGAAGPYLRRSLGGVLRLRRMPELEFLEDRSLEQAMRIEELLTEVRPEGGWVESEDGTDAEEGDIGADDDPGHDPGDDHGHDPDDDPDA